MAGLVITAPWWWPVVRRVTLDVWETSEDGAEPDAPRQVEASEPKKTPVTWSRKGKAWSKRRLINSEWDTGRPAVAKKTPGFKKTKRSGFDRRAS